MTDQPWHHGVSPLAVAAALAGLGALGLVVALTRQPASAPAPRPPGPGPGPGPGGCINLALVAQGPGSVSGCGAWTHDQTSLCVPPGQSCDFTASPDPGAYFTGWQGPGGVASQQNPVSLTVYSPGFVQGTFGGLPAPPGRTPCPTDLGTIVTSDAPNNPRQYVIDACGAKHWIDSGFQFAACFYNPFGIATCNVDALPEGPAVSALNCCPGTGDGQCRGC